MLLTLKKWIRLRARTVTFNLATFGTSLSRTARSNLISHITFKCYIIECIRPLVHRQLLAPRLWATRFRQIMLPAYEQEWQINLSPGWPFGIH
jgi:hypothetical protein